MASVARQAYFGVMKQFHQRPVVLTCFLLGAFGYTVAAARILSTTEAHPRAFIKQNPMDMDKLYNYAVDDEIYLLLTSPLDKIPVKKRNAWQHLGSVEPLFKQLNALSVEDQTGPASEQLKRQYRAAAHRFMFTMAQQNGYISPEQQYVAESAALKDAQLPTPEPITIREWPLDY